jgi:DNA-binding GntR family transcriptional regulator
MIAAIANDEPLIFFRHNQIFHDLLFKATKNNSLLEMMQGLEKQMMLYLHREATKAWMLKDSNKQHLKIINCISKGDAEETANAFLKHVLFGKQRIVNQWE